MSIAEFCVRHPSDKAGAMEQLAGQWEYEREVDDLLHKHIGPGLLAKDLLSKDGLLDQVSPELRDAFRALTGDKTSYGDVRKALLDASRRGDASVAGLVSKIKGQVAENRFVAEMGSTARLADLSNQEAWDVAIDHDWGTQYVQVKTYSNANGVVRHMKEVSSKLSGGRTILDGEQVVGRIDFAVPRDIAEEVARKAEAAGLDIRVIPVETTAQDAADVVWRGVENVGSGAFKNFAGKMVRAAGQAAAIHCVASACLVYKGAKRPQEAVGDIAQNTAVSVAGTIAGASVEVVLKRLSLGAGPAGWLIFGASTTSMAVLRRVLERTDYVSFLREKNEGLELLTQAMLAPLKPEEQLP